MHYFCVGLLCLLLLFYLAQTIILPARRISVHLCFTICTSFVALGTSISLSDKIKGLATPSLLHLNQQIKHRRFIRCCFFLLLWFLALLCSYIGLVKLAFQAYTTSYLALCCTIAICRENAHLTNRLQSTSHLSTLRIQDVTMDRYTD